MKRSNSETFQAPSTPSSQSDMDSSAPTAVAALNTQLQGPPAKKLKGVPRKPIVFETPGQVADTRVKIFDQEFHVSSTALKMYTMYFQKFMDPSNGIVNKTISSRFKYNWFTKIEEDGQWVISSAPEVVLDASLAQIIVC
jgi:hypothetical protein